LRGPGAPGVAMLAAGIAAALHLVYQVQAIRAGGGIHLDFFAALSWVGVGTSLVTLTVAAARPVLALGTIAFPIAAGTLLLYHFAGTHHSLAAPVTSDPRIQLHALLALLAYAALSVAALMALMLWFHD